MKSKLTGLLVLLLTSVLFLTGCGSDGKSDGDKDKVVIRMSNLVSDDNFLNVGYEKFKEVVEKESAGEIEVQIYNNGTLASSDDMHQEMLESGALEVNSVPGFTIANATKIPGYNIFDVPFLFENQEAMYKVLDGAYGEKLIKELEDSSNVKVLGFFDLGTYSIGNNKKAIEAPADAKGLKIRSSATQLHVDTLNAIGASPTPLAYGEVFTGLQQGAIDGLQTTTPLIYGDRFYEVIDHLTLTRHVPLPHVLEINRKFYDNLSEQHKEIVIKAAEEHIKYARELSINSEAEAIKGLKENGVEVFEPTSEQLEKFKAAVQPAIEKNIKEFGQENYDEVIRLLKE